MKNFIITSLVIMSLTGCAPATSLQASQTNQLSAATEIVSKPEVIPSVPSKNDYSLVYGNNPALAKAYRQYMQTGKAPNIVTDGFEQFAYGNSQPIIAASPFELTVISLEAGENVTNVSSGDPLRWSYSLAYSGQGKDRQAHIMIKPADINLSTDLVITTDRRMYTLKLVSSNDKFIKDVRFWYPDEIQSYWDQYNASQSTEVSNPETIQSLPDINLNDLNFDYSITSSSYDTPSWQPTRVFDDGIHTYIQFPSSMTSQDMPVLFVQTGKDQELVNYRSKPPYFVVDKIFKQAVLVMGVGRNQTKVTITNNHSF